MNIKDWAYHWTREENASRIMKEGLLPSGGRHGQGVYLSSDPYQHFGDVAYDTLFAVHLRGLERQLLTVPDKKWLVCRTRIKPDHLGFVGGAFSNESSLRKAIHETREAFSLTNPRAAWPVRTQLIEEFDVYQRSREDGSSLLEHTIHRF